MSSVRSSFSHSALKELLYHDSVPVYPYVAAFTGHRSFYEDQTDPNVPGFTEQQLKEAFAKQLEAIVRLWNRTCNPDKSETTSRAPFLLMLGLADGSDQLAAEVALSEKFQKLGVKVVVVLPMKADVFRLTVANKERFDELLRKVFYVHEIPVDAGDSKKSAVIEEALRRVDDPSTEKFRQAQYVLQADFMISHSHVLFAFWDGIDLHKPGGASCTIRYKLFGNDRIEDQVSNSLISSVGPVVQFLTPRNKTEEEIAENKRNPIDPSLERTEAPVFLWSRYSLIDYENGLTVFPTRKEMTEENRRHDVATLEEAGKTNEIVNTISALGQLNRLSLERFDSVSPRLSSVKKSLFELDKGSSLDVFLQTLSREDVELSVLLDHYACADVLAQTYQARTKRRIIYYAWLLLGSSILGGTISALWELFDNDWVDPNRCSTWLSRLIQTQMGEVFSCAFINTPRLSLLYFAITATLLLLLYCSYTNPYHLIFHRFRAMAEALRVQLFWRIAGVNETTSNCFHSHHTNKTEWIRAGINGVCALFTPIDLDSDNVSETEKERRFTLVKESWCKAQSRYFIRTTKKRKEASNINWNQKQLEKAFGAPDKSENDFVVRPLAEKLARALDCVLRFCSSSSKFHLVLFFFIAVIQLLFGDAVNEAIYEAFPENHLWGCVLVTTYNVVLSSVVGLVLFVEVIKGLNRLEEEAERYERAHFPFERAVRLLNNASDSDKIRQIFRQLGEEAISENTDWYLAIGEQELTIPR